MGKIQIDSIINLIDKYWKFDNNQQHMSGWHDKQDLLEELRKLGNVITNEEIESTSNCPTCGAPAQLSWSGLDLVDNTGDETLAQRHYKYESRFEKAYLLKIIEKSYRTGVLEAVAVGENRERLNGLLITSDVMAFEIYNNSKL